MNHKRVERLWRREGLKVPREAAKEKAVMAQRTVRAFRRRPERKNHVWSYDFVQTRTAEGRAVRLLTLMDEYTRECLAIRVGRKLGSEEVIETLADLFVRRGVPEYLRSDNGPEFVAKILREWLARLQVQTLYIEPGSPWENGYIESFNGKLRDELLNPGDLRHALRNAGAGGALAHGVQRAAAAQFIGLSATRTGGVRAVCSELRDSVPAPAENGPDPNLESGTTLGAGQLQDVVQVSDRPVAAAASQDSFLFHS